MKRVLAIGAALALLLVASSAVYAAEKSISGTITSVDMEQRMLVVKDSTSKEHTVYWNESTRLDGGPLQQGATVKLQTSDDGGKNLATSIQVSGKAPAKEPAKEKAPPQ
jgi:hypothetical protein